MQIDTEQIIPITRLQKELTAKLRELTDTEEPLFVMRNNAIAAVIVSPAEYELLQNAVEVLEHLEIADVIEKRLKTHDPSRNISWDRVKAEHGL